MTTKQIAIISSVVGNCFLFGMFGFAVFVLGVNPWWFALPVLVHFRIGDWEDKKLDDDEDDD